MENRVKLTFDKTVTRLAGYSYGEQIYLNQVKNKVDFNNKVYIEFPDQIVKAASSFVQGFFNEMINEHGLSSIGTKIEIVSDNPDLIESICTNLV